MEYLRAKLVRVLTEYFGRDDRRIEHALLVLHHVERIMADYPGCDADVVIASAVLHDVGIKVSEEKLGYNNGKTQEEYGPRLSRRVSGHLAAAEHAPGAVGPAKTSFLRPAAQPRARWASGEP